MKSFNRSSNTITRVFTQVDYRRFREHLADFHTPTVECKGFETVIFDQCGDIQAILHAASIDAAGRCHPAEYFIRTSALSHSWDQAA